MFCLLALLLALAPDGTFRMLRSVAAVPAQPARRPLASLEEIYRSKRSVVWVHKLDSAGKRFDTASGFVIGKDLIATAFQAIDSAAALEIEFEGGRKITTDDIRACDRLQDWALVNADTAEVPPFARGTIPAVGETVIGLAAEDTTRSIGSFDVKGHTGERLLLQPPPFGATIGGPVLNHYGEVVGILGGAEVPASRFNSREASVHSMLSARFRNAATAISAVPASPSDPPRKLGELLASGVLTLAVSPMDEIVSGGTATAVLKGKWEPANDRGEFSRKDAEVWVYNLWRRKDKSRKGVMSAAVYDASNRTRIVIPPKKLSVSDSLHQSSLSFSPAALPAGIYRIDVLWDGQPVWRTFVAITD